MSTRTDKKELFKGIKTLVFALLSLFMGPILLSAAFSKPDDKLYLPLLIMLRLLAICPVLPEVIRYAWEIAVSPVLADMQVGLICQTDVSKTKQKRMCVVLNLS